MNTGNLSSFLSTGFITILASGAIILILKHWKEQLMKTIKKDTVLMKLKLR